MFSCHAKQKIELKEQNNMVYKFLCPCHDFYIGQTKRLLKIRIEDHQRPSSGSHVCKHIENCSKYIHEASQYAINCKNQYTSPKKAKFAFFMSRFSSIEKGFRNDQARRNCEAYHIRLKRPKINDQKDLKAFRLF